MAFFNDNQFRRLSMAVAITELQFMAHDTVQSGMLALPLLHK
jgi:hypothetical protein